MITRGVAVMVAVAVTGVAAAGGAAAVAATPPPNPSAQPQGAFQMNGTVTAAQNVRGEHVGQVVTRSWTFTPQCQTAPCATVQLVRGRATGNDTLTLTRTRPGNYAGNGIFYTPLRCSGHIYPRGQEIPFRITVRVTASNGTTASAISATYVNRERTNLTPCIGILGHDSARYIGLPAVG